MTVRLRVGMAFALVGAVILAGWSITAWRDALQESRMRSCRQTYQAFIEVFRPYFPSSRPAELAKFKRTVARLKSRCAEQTS